jgi:quinoprotein glucose dehydrogenase
MRQARTAAIAALIAAAGCHRDLAPPAPGPAAGWPAYGADSSGSRYSPASQIDRANVRRLQVAWTYRTGEDLTSPYSNRKAFEATPILQDGRLYLSTPSSRVIALDPETGRELWVYDPQIRPGTRFSEHTSRGVSAWQDPEAGPCPFRIFVGTIDARLIALDGRTGRPCPGFGTNGQVDLSQGVGQVSKADYQVTSPPAILRNLVIVGSAIGDNRGVEVERGVVRAFDARSGALRWSWDPIPRDPADPARATWERDSADRTGAANAWSILSVDPDRDLVFVPTTSPSPDFYGGERLGDNRYASSVVALRGATGKLVWHYQVVHHDLWDYDVPAQPTLITVRRDGRETPAVAQATKMGHLFLLHRETGEPLFPVEERAVPQTKVPGERTSPTQPFPTAPPPLVPQKLTPDDAWGITPWDRGKCRDLIARSRSEGIFTPPSIEGTIMFPGNAGGANWGSVAFDPGRGLVVVNSTRLAFLVALIPREQLPGLKRGRAEVGRQEGTPYAMRRETLVSPLDLPCNPPPWGTLAAVDVATGSIRWEVPLGTVRDRSWQ